MKAVKFVGAHRPFEVWDVADPSPGEGEVVVRVEASGVCRSEHHLMSGLFPSRAPTPHTPGHEAAGRVVAAGRAVEYWRPGMRGAVLFNPRRCGACTSCMAGLGSDECGLPLLMGMDFDGAWAEYVMVPAHRVIRIPDGVSTEEAALLADCVSTAFNAVVDVGAVRAGDRVAVFGVGGLGLHSVQLARLSGAATVVAVEPRENARKAAVELGADTCIDPDQGPASDAIRAVTAGAGVDVALECSGDTEALSQAVMSLAVGGRCVVVGVGMDPVTLWPTMPFVALKSQVLSALTYTARHYRAALRLTENGRLDLSRSIGDRLPLEAVNDAITALGNANHTGRTILTPRSDSHV